MGVESLWRLALSGWVRGSCDAGPERRADKRLNEGAIQFCQTLGELKMLNLMTMADACAALHTSRRTIYRMIAAGSLPAPRAIGSFRTMYFFREEFEIAVKKGMGLRTARSSLSRKT